MDAMGRTKVLFVCYGNVDRSPTAEEMFKRRPGLEVMSAGIAAAAGGRQLTRRLVDWADMIFVMEEYQAERVRALNPEAGRKVVVLGIPDNYFRNDPALRRLLEERVSPHLPRT
ncbi:MAG: phosphotyrosine protein phosphatase [Candidatus Brockarchaeota archaeon]|nr:phosphotyrosine protein phosphatase [Candidatus Brockarchaeota archaeon]